MFYNIIIEDKEGNECFLFDCEDTNKIKDKIQKFKNYQDFIIDGYICNRKDIKRFKVTCSENQVFIIANIEKNSDKKDESINELKIEIANMFKDVTDDLVNL